MNRDIVFEERTGLSALSLDSLVDGLGHPQDPAVILDHTEHISPLGQSLVSAGQQVDTGTIGEGRWGKR